jgi:AraC-like DNA-binding protein
MFVKVSVLKNIIYSVAKNEQEALKILKLADFDLQDMEDQDMTIDWEKGQAIWKIVEEFSNDSNIGLHVGYQTPIESTGLVGLLARNSPTLEKAWVEISTFYSLFTNMMNYSFLLDSEQFVLKFSPAIEWYSCFPNSSRHAVSQAIMATLQIFSALCRKKLTPTSIHFTFCKPENSSDYYTLLGNNIHFGSDKNAILFSSQVAKFKIVSYSSSVYLSLKQICNNQLHGDSLQEKSITSMVRNSILKNMDSGNCTLKAVAIELGIGERTLQRKLSSEGVSFKTFLNKTRMDIAKVLLKKGDFNINEIANQLGYMEVSSFRKRFVQEVGKNPKQYQLMHHKE